MAYLVDYSSKFKKNYKRIVKQGKDLKKLNEVINKLSNGIQLEEKYKNHNLVDDGYYKKCIECHIEPDWLLIYKYDIENEILVLVDTGSHSDLFK